MRTAKRLMWWTTIVVFVSGCAYRPAVLPQSDATADAADRQEQVEAGTTVRISLAGGETITGKVESVTAGGIVLYVQHDRTVYERLEIHAAEIESIEVRGSKYTFWQYAISVAVVGLVVGGVVLIVGNQGGGGGTLTGW